MSRPKAIQIGFNKTGTTSLARFFKNNGYTVAGGEIAIKAFRNIQEQRDPLHNLEFDLAQDIENHKLGIYIYNYFELIHNHHPDAKFILTTRSCEKWINSRLSHNGGRYVRRALRRLGLHNVETLCDTWRRDFYHYHAKVLDYFSGRPNFYIHSLECLNVASLTEFLSPEFKFHDLTYPHSNPKRAKTPVSYDLSIED